MGGVPASVAITGAGYRLTDGTDEYWHNGASWEVNTTDWNTEEEVAAEIRARGGEAIANADNVADWEGAQHLVNSAIEAIVDRIGNEFNELSGRAKDLGSAAVFVCLLASALSWLAIAFQNLRGEPMT